MKVGKIRPAIMLAILAAAGVAVSAILQLDDPDHVVTVATGFILGVLGLGNKIVEADMSPE